MFTALVGKLQAQGRLLCLGVLLFGSGPAYAVSASPNPNTGSYTVSWSGINGGYSYTLHETFEGETTTYSFFGSTIAFEKSFSGKAVGFYTYRLYACWFRTSGPTIEIGENDCDFVGGSLTVRVRPPVPVGLDAPSLDYNGDFTVSWNTAAGFTSKLRERLNSGGWSTVHSGSAESDFRPNRTPGTWRYGVQACKGTNCSNWSSSITVQVPPPPPAPTGLGGPTTDYNGVFTMSWNGSSGATSYQLFELRPGGTTHTYTVSSTSQGITGKLTAPGVYRYRVRGCMPESVCGSWSGYVNVAVEVPPDTPSLSGPVEPVRDDETYTISWTDTDPVFYELEEKAAGGVWEPVPLGPGLLSETLSKNDSGIWLYRVQACNPEDACSGWSSSISVTVKLVYTTRYEYDALGRLIEVEQQ